MVRETYGPDKGTVVPHRIVVLVDGSANADAAFEAAVQYKKHEHHLLVVHSVNLVRPWTAGPHAGPYLDANTLHKTNESLVHAAKHMLAKYSKCAQQLKVPNVQAYVITSDENPKDAALHFAKEQNAKLIVIGSRGISGLQRLLMGSFSNHVVNNAFCDVLVARTSGHKSIKELPGLLGTATRQDLAKIATQPLVHTATPPKDAATTQHELQGAIKHKLVEKQKEITELLEQLSLAEQQREEEFHNAEREYTKRKDSETAHAVADAQRNEEARAKALKEKDELAAQIKRKEEEIHRLREDQTKVVAQYKQQVIENEQRTREKQEAIADSRRRSDEAEKEKQRLASLLRLTEEKSEKERLKLEKERKQLEDLAHSREQESEQQRALRVQQLKEKEAEVVNERARQAHGRQELALAIAARDKQIAEELAKEKRLESEVETERKRERDLEKQCNELSAKLDRLHKTHSDDLTHLRTEMSEKETKWQSDRNEYRQQLQSEKQNLLRIIQQKECELEAERAKRKEAELLRSKDTESRIHEKASASRMLREEAQRTEREAEAQLEAQRALSKRKADEARQAEARAASVHAAEGQYSAVSVPAASSEEEHVHEHEEHREREEHHSTEQLHVAGVAGSREGKSCLIS